MSETTRINKIVDRAYARLHVLNDIKWSPYRDRCFDMACAEERQHRRSFKPDGMALLKGASVQAAARLFVVKRIAEYLSVGGKRATIADVLHFQPSAIYAASLVANYGAEILKAWEGLDITELADLDYCKFIGSAP